MKLLTGPLSMFGTKARIAVAEKNAPCEIEYVPFSLKTRYNPLHPDVARLNPKGQVPVLLDGEVEIFDSTQIFEYLEEKFPEPPLWPRSIEARAMARLMELKADEIYFPNVIVLINAAADISRPECKEALEKMAAYYRDMDARLADQEFIAEGYSYADIAFFTASYFASFLGGAPDLALSHLAAWRKRIAARSAVAPIVKDVADYLAANRLPVPEI
jgi:glutathione S-transferase